jgi:hypothetical protein
MFKWTEENLNRAKEIWLRGETAQHVADILGCTRNAVIGKMNREGIKHNAKPKPEKENVVKFTEKLCNYNFSKLSSKKSRKHKGLPIMLNDVKPEYKKMIDLKINECRYPFGDVKTNDIVFCACRTHPNRSYCPEHNKLTRRKN